MILGIDACNIRAGGSVTHLVELLHSADPTDFGFKQVIVWGVSSVLGRMADRPWLRKIVDPMIEQSRDPFADRRQLYRAYWQRMRLPALARAAGCDLLFVPGGLDGSRYDPTATMSQNMLPFEWHEARRYGFSLSTLRLILLYVAQARTFRRARGILFLTRYAKEQISKKLALDTAKAVVVPHGIGAHFFQPPRLQRPISACSTQSPFKILYVSTIDLYKHQWHVAEAVAALRREGLPVTLELLGPARQPALQRLERTLARLDPQQEFLRYLGPVAYDRQPEFYANADVCVFASSCENMPLILLEGMASGMPIASSNRGPMPEVLGDAGVYFDPEQPQQIAQALRQLIHSPELRRQKALMARELAGQYSWRRCAAETFAFLAECAQRAARGDARGIAIT